MTTDQILTLIDKVKSLPVDQRAQFQTLIIMEGIGRIVYYVAAALLAWALGRRLIQACLTAYRESLRRQESSADARH